MGKRKLFKYSAINNFSNVFQTDFPIVLSTDFHLKSNWSTQIFKNNNPITLELGCGKGEYTLGLAEKHPDRNFIGVDIKGDRIWMGASEAIEKNLTNVAFLRTAIDHIELCFSANEVSEIWICFPDPFPRKPQIKKRLTSPSFLNRYKNLLKPDALIHLKTDDEYLFDYTIHTIYSEKHFLLEHTYNLYTSNINSEASQIQTYYETMFRKQNMNIHYLKFKLRAQ